MISYCASAAPVDIITDRLYEITSPKWIYTIFFPLNTRPYCTVYTYVDNANTNTLHFSLWTNLQTVPTRRVWFVTSVNYSNNNIMYYLAPTVYYIVMLFIT